MTVESNDSGTCVVANIPIGKKEQSSLAEPLQAAV
jgi:hypothetical protein